MQTADTSLSDSARAVLGDIARRSRGDRYVAFPIESERQVLDLQARGLIETRQGTDKRQARPTLPGLILISNSAQPL